MAIISLAFPVYSKVTDLVNTQSIPEYQDIIQLAAFSLNLLLTITISMFFKFHVGLVLGNSTTIDNMDKKNIQKNNVYDKGKKNNWQQVFGQNKWLWPFPINGISGKPIGDGVIWTQENNNIDEEIPGNEVEVRKSIPENLNSFSKPGQSHLPFDAKKKEENDTKQSTDSYRKLNPRK